MIVFSWYLTQKSDQPDLQNSPTDKPTQAFINHSQSDSDEESRRLTVHPVCVMVENTSSARPQAGLRQADTVIEALAEGGITRYLAIFETVLPDRVGPVRSARPYFIERAMEYGGLYVHCGGSPEALALLKSQSVLEDVDDLRGARGFSRSSSRKPPHNLYSNLRIMVDAYKTPSIVKEKVANTVDNLKVDEEKHLTSDIDIRFSRYHQVTFKYDERSRVWLRFVNGQPDIDESKAQLSADTIVIQEVDYEVMDDAGRLEMDMVGEGRASFIIGDRYVPCRWRKTSKESSTEYTAGSTKLSPKGKMWVEVVPPGWSDRIDR